MNEGHKLSVLELDIEKQKLYRSDGRSYHYEECDYNLIKTQESISEPKESFQPVPSIKSHWPDNSNIICYGERETQDESEDIIQTSCQNRLIYRSNFLHKVKCETLMEVSPKPGVTNRQEWSDRVGGVWEGFQHSNSSQNIYSSQENITIQIKENFDENKCLKSYSISVSEVISIEKFREGLESTSSEPILWHDQGKIHEIHKNSLENLFAKSTSLAKEVKRKIDILLEYGSDSFVALASLSFNLSNSKIVTIFNFVLLVTIFIKFMIII
ncbi:unnamed protein product [Moneuplotes crassus]|uniref:Uncharacterized protein n=1 Tax=Euplotes crassus TaxID=5936 RepID=A0AAD1UNH5_EUPCR|nr:unnamed protein product [Moneuplotes crassus]